MEKKREEMPETGFNWKETKVNKHEGNGTVVKIVITEAVLIVVN